MSCEVHASFSHFLPSLPPLQPKEKKSINISLTQIIYLFFFSVVFPQLVIVCFSSCVFLLSSFYLHESSECLSNQLLYLKSLLHCDFLLLCYILFYNFLLLFYSYFFTSDFVVTEFSPTILFAPIIFSFLFFFSFFNTEVFLMVSITFYPFLVKGFT